MALGACVGSGLCCMKGPCPLFWTTREGTDAELAPWRRGQGCPELRWDVEQGRYFCQLVEYAQRDYEKAAYVSAVLYIGEGCCMSLFNEVRERILAGETRGRPDPREGRP